MMSRIRRRAVRDAVVCVPMIVVLVTARPAAGAQEPYLDVAARAQGAERVVTATVSQVVAREVQNEFGDRLIVSRATLVVDEVLKGPAVRTLTLDVEGGTIGDITMRVSDLPVVQAGDRAVFFVTRSATGLNIPHRRGHGILKLDSDDVVEGTSLPLHAIRTQIVQP